MISQLTVMMTWLQQEVRNIYYVNHPGTDEVAETSEAVQSIASAYSILLDSLVNDLQMYEIAVRRVDSPGWPSYAPFAVAPENGSMAGDSVVTQVAGVIKFSSFTQKPRKSIKFIPGLPEDAFTNSVMTQAYVDTLGIFATTLRANLAANTPPTPLVAVEWNATKTHVVAWNPISAHRVSPIAGVQRRRKIGRGQ